MRVSWLLETRKDVMKTISACIFLFAKGYRTPTSGWHGPPCFRRYGRELVSKPAISLKKSWGGYRKTTRKCRLSDLMGFHTCRKDFFYVRCILFFMDGRPTHPGGANSARFARLTLVGRSAGRQLASPVDLPTKFSQSLTAPTD